jgi:hypothetical protein
MDAKKKWSDLSDPQKGAVVLGGVLELVLTAVALRDLGKRPAGQVRGPKALWVAAMAVQPFGPLAYLGMGRKRGTPTT